MIFPVLRNGKSLAFYLGEQAEDLDLWDGLPEELYGDFPCVDDTFDPAQVEYE